MLLTCHCRSKPGIMANTFTPAIKFNGKCSFYERLNWLNSLVNIHSAFFCARSFPCSKINRGALKSRRSVHSARFSAKLSTRNLIMCSPKWGITYPVMLKLKSGAKAWRTTTCWDESFPLLFFPPFHCWCCAATFPQLNFTFHSLRCTAASSSHVAVALWP